MPITAQRCIPDINPPERLPLFIRFTILGAINQTQKDREPDWPGFGQESSLEQSIVTKRPWGGVTDKQTNSQIDTKHKWRQHWGMEPGTQDPT